MTTVLKYALGAIIGGIACLVVWTAWLEKPVRKFADKP